MKIQFFGLLFLSAALFVFCGCAVVEQTVPYSGKKIKTAFYIGNGSSGGGVIHLARLLEYSPQVELTLIDGEDMRKGKLDGFDLVVMPGGSSGRQMKSMGKAGVAALRDFIRKGGSYIGVCAGCHITLNRKVRARIMPYTLMSNAGGYIGDVYIDLSEKGAKLLDIPQERYCVRYSQGPIMEPAEWEHGKCETLAVYKSSLGPIGKKGKSFFDTPAMIYGNFGKGKVIATSFHPEYKIDTYKIFNGCFYAVTGVKLTPQIPEKQFRPLYTAYYFGFAQGKSRAAVIADIIEIEKYPEIYVEPSLLDVDMLHRTDVVILGDSADDALKKLSKTKHPAMLHDFMNRKGKVIGVGNAWKNFSKHENFIRVKDREEMIEKLLEIAD